MPCRRPKPQVRDVPCVFQRLLHTSRWNFLEGSLLISLEFQVQVYDTGKVTEVSNLTQRKMWKLGVALMPVTREPHKSPCL